MRKKLYNENEFFPAPGGTNGTVNYQTPLNTHTSPDTEQHIDKFNTVPMDSTSNGQSTIPAQPHDIKQSIDKIYSKKTVPTADQVVAGLQYELHNMTKPDKTIAKTKVLANLKKDPEYYGKLHQLNIDDEAMTDFVPTNEDATKKIFKEMLAAKQPIRKTDTNIAEIIRDMWNKKKNK